MRLSCNGCRVLRKGCGDDCVIKPCLVWIKNPESQEHATLFLAKFYGRAGLLNLISAGPPHLRPAIFRSLLYESCGRIINPIYGSVGLLWSNRWHLCQAAVEAVLKGIPISQIPSDNNTDASSSPHIKTPGDIRHVNKEMDAKLHKLSKTNRSRFKGEGSKPNDRAKVRSHEVIEIGSSQSEEKNDDTEHEQDNDALDFNMEQEQRSVVREAELYHVVREAELYQMDLNL